MQFSPMATDVAAQMQEVVSFILGLNVSPAEKRERLRYAFNEVGNAFFQKSFTDSSELFDSEAIGTLGFADNDDQIGHLAYKLVQNYNLGREAVNATTVRSFFDSVLGDAQSEAYRNAISLDKHPTLERIIVGETCEWCRDLAGIHTDPGPEMFARHADCDCLFITRGWNSRNGILTNYVKRSTT